MTEIALAAMALAGPKFGPPTNPCSCITIGPGPPPQQVTPVSTGGPPSFTITAAPTIGVGEDADFYVDGAGLDSKVRLCYQVGSSIVGCSTSGTDWWHLTIRGGSMQYVTARLGEKIYARAVYRDGKLIS
jgi:hypothetical protein